MNTNKITDIKFYATRSKDKNFYEAVARFYYEGKPVKYYIFVEREPGLTNKDYFAEAKNKFQRNLEKGIIEKYCRGIYPATISRKKSIAILAPLLAGAIVFAALFIWQTNIRSKPEMVTFDAEDGTLELYDTRAIRIPYIENTTWSQFYPDSNYLGATKEGYDFICWSLDGKNPIPNDYVINKPITLKPLYVKNRNCLTISCRFFDERNPNADQIYTTRDNYEYALNGGKFVPYDFNEIGELEDFKTGDYVSFRKTVKDEDDENIAITDSGSKTRFAISGSIDALTHNEDFLSYEFNSCFGSDTGLCSASGFNLGGHPLLENCFLEMFGSCSNLLFAPKLPSTTLANGCYSNMFYECTSLIEAPELPAVTLANNCYEGMFGKCYALTKAPELPATTLAEKCYMGMFKECSSLAKAPSIIPAKHVPPSAFRQMFEGCTNLKHAPNLSKIKSVQRISCQHMFYECTSLISVEDFNPEIIGYQSCDAMFRGCSSLIKGPKILSANKHFGEYEYEDIIIDGLHRSCYREMFSGCTSLEIAPEIKATILPSTVVNEAVFDRMFNGCSSLNSIKIHYASIFDPNIFNDWVSGVASEGTFYYNGEDTATGTSAIPVGWEVKTF